MSIQIKLIIISDVTAMVSIMSLPTTEEFEVAVYGRPYASFKRAYEKMVLDKKLEVARKEAERVAQQQRLKKGELAYQREVVLQKIRECDIRNGTKLLSSLIRCANRIARVPHFGWRMY